MNKIFVILFSLILFSCFSMLEYSLEKMENDLDKRVDKCNPFCTDYQVSGYEWCDCMYTCLNNGSMKWKLSECESDTTIQR